MLPLPKSGELRAAVRVPFRVRTFSASIPVISTDHSGRRPQCEDSRARRSRLPARLCFGCRSSHLSNSFPNAKTGARGPRPTRCTGILAACSHRWTVRTPRARYVAISFQEFSSMCLEIGECAIVEFILCCSLVCWPLQTARTQLLASTRVTSKNLHDAAFAAGGHVIGNSGLMSLWPGFSGIPGVPFIATGIEDTFWDR